MAYASAVTVVRKGKEITVTIVETDARDTSEPAAIDLAIIRGRVLKQECHLTDGTGTTVDPVLGKVTNPAASPDKVIVSNATPAANVANQSLLPGTTFDITGPVYHRSVPNNATEDHDITTIYHILVGWHD